MSVSEWIEKTNAIGIIVKKGRYGGTYAFKDIAFECTRVSSFRFHPSLFTVHYSLAKRCFALSPRLLRAEGPSAPCAWLASAVRVISELHCKGTKISDTKQCFPPIIFD
jgi:hypothetical protein